MSNFVIIHFGPLEMYPPVQNLLRLLEQLPTKGKIYVFTTAGVYKELKTFGVANKNIIIKRLGSSGSSVPFMLRYWTYLYFNLGSLLYLAWLSPKKILYYETISSFAACIYRRLINHNTSLLIHYHEYITPAEYQSGMSLNRYFHQLEKSIYPLTVWVSHTNPARMQLFLHDIAPVECSNPQVVPNYPPKSWYRVAAGHRDSPTRVVYVGALSLDTMFTREFANWVLEQQGRVSWDIYSYNISGEAKQYIHSFPPGLITVKQGLDYDELPALLQQYDVGVILYTGHIPNYILNAPNKLFEYHACGLDVWYPDQMTGIHPYQTRGTYPAIIPLDFSQLATLSPEQLRNKKGLSVKQTGYFCEDSLEKLVGMLVMEN